MNFIKFPVEATNIFPIANTVNGGQLVTEYNLRSRESVYSNSSVEYFIGPSFVHSERDFYVSLESGGASYFPDSTATSSNVLQISAGRGVINGHYVECLVPVTIDLFAEIPSPNDLSGTLCIGLKAMYSTERTISGSIRAEHEEGSDVTKNMYEGIQVIILPKDTFKLPVDSPDDPNGVTAHIKLAEFEYNSGVIYNIRNNYPEKCKMIDAERIGDIEGILSDKYISNIGLNPEMFYTYGGKYDSTTGESSMGWCNSTSSLMVWDVEVPTFVYEEPEYNTATFARNGDSVNLVVPHKQIDGLANSGKYFKPVYLPIPAANFDDLSSGIVTSAYTQKIIDLDRRVREIYELGQGKLRGYIATLENIDDLPEIQPDWESGDYILVSQDFTVKYDTVEPSRKPSTLYTVLDGYVTSLDQPMEIQPSQGRELASVIKDELPDDTNPEVWQTYWGDLTKYFGEVGKDYFVYNVAGGGTWYSIVRTTNRGYSDAVLVTGSIPLAEERIIGGFLNSPEQAVDAGYVYRDSQGYLKLRDYALLRSGTLAYQLGQDYSVPSGLTLTEIQKYLDEYVNQRIAFPNNHHLEQSSENNGVYPNRITVSIEISDSESGELNIYDLDSRFDTSVYLKITTSGSVNCVINVSDCEKIQIDPSVAKLDGITVNVYRSNLYYNAAVFDSIATMRDIKIWYNRFENTDPILTVEGMTISQMTYDGQYDENSVISFNDWSHVDMNDYHFDIALQSITFSSDGYVNGCGLLVRNRTTSVQSGKVAIRGAGFRLPYGPNLEYPESRIIRPVKVTGQFISAYADPSSNLIIQDTSFSAMSQFVGRQDSDVNSGDIAFLVDSYSIPNVSGGVIEEWNPYSFNYFYGTTKL